MGIFSSISSFLGGLVNAIKGLQGPLHEEGAEPITGDTEENAGVGEEELEDTVQKYVSATVYCGGTKEVYYGLTYEDSDNDREQDLLNAIESETGGRCSEIRLNHGYSQTDGFFDVRGAEYPDIEVGTV